MADKNDNVLLIIAVIVVIVAAIVFFATYTKFFAFEQVLLEPEPGNVTVIISQNLDIVFTTNLINWSTGSVGVGAPSTNLSSEGEINGNISFRNVTDGFLLENVGNVNASLNLSMNNNATIFIGGDFPISPEYQFKLRSCNNANCTYSGVINITDTTQSCKNATSGIDNLNLGVYRNVSNTPNQQVVACPIFEWDDFRDELRIDIRVVIPSNAPPGAKQSTVTAHATSP